MHSTVVTLELKIPLPHTVPENWLIGFSQHVQPRAILSYNSFRKFALNKNILLNLRGIYTKHFQGRVMILVPFLETAISQKLNSLLLVYCN